MVTEEMARLRWHCRRGMLELDLLLETFLDRDYPRLTAQEQTDFQRLLQTQDPQLNAWLLGDEAPGDMALENLIQRLRQTWRD